MKGQPMIIPIQSMEVRRVAEDKLDTIEVSLHRETILSTLEKTDLWRLSMRMEHLPSLPKNRKQFWKSITNLNQLGSKCL